MSRELILSLTKKDFRWDYYRGSGKGGQKRNKTENCCRCTHEPSGAVGKSEEGRSKDQNTKKAFRRVAESEKFRQWIRLAVARKTGEIAEINRKIERELKTKIKCEVKDSGGRWVSDEILEKEA